MRWFKHDCTALKDEAVQRLMEEFGPSAYVVYFGLCELCGEKIDASFNPTVSITWSFLEKLLHVRRATIRRVLTGCASAGLLAWKANERQITCHIPNMLKRLDNYRKDLQASCKKLPSKEVEVDVEVEKEVEKRPAPSADSFNLVSETTKKIGTCNSRKTDLQNIHIQCEDQILGEPAKNKIAQNLRGIFDVRGWKPDLIPSVFEAVAERIKDAEIQGDLFPYFEAAVTRYINENSELLTAGSRK